MLSPSFDRSLLFRFYSISIILDFFVVPSSFFFFYFALNGFDENNQNVFPFFRVSSVFGEKYTCFVHSNFGKSYFGQAISIKETNKHTTHRVTHHRHVVVDCRHVGCRHDVPPCMGCEQWTLCAHVIRPDWKCLAINLLFSSFYPWFCSINLLTWVCMCALVFCRRCWQKFAGAAIY